MAHRAHRATVRTGRPRRLAFAGLASILVLIAGTVAVPITSPAAAAAYAGWYKTDLHVHSVYSADARPDLGIIAHNASAAGYNAIFVTDHNLASSFPINSLTANHLVLEDSYTRWTAASSGSLTSSTNAFSSSQVHSGTSSLHLSATSASAGQSFAWSTRGPNLASGDSIVKFSVFPQRIDSGSSLYISASLGGDPAVKGLTGFTTAAGVVSPGKSFVFVWYFGDAPSSSLFPGSTVVATPLNGSGACDRGYVTGGWISCTVDLNASLGRLASADLPESHDAWTDLKVAAAGAAGTADGYFDSYSIDATAPVAAGSEFVDRNASLSLTGAGRWDTSGFHLFPSIELGIGDHSQRFNFGIADPASNLWYQHGTDGIPVTQASGYPAQLNHPGVAGGVTQQEAIDTNGEGADLVEVRQPVMIASWDGILSKGTPIVGTWGTDNHNASWGSGSQATVINAPDMSFDSLMRSLFEGRIYLSNVGFSGRATLNLDCGSAPYPARYPVFVSSLATSASACFTVSGGIGSGSSVAWISGGTTIGTAAASGSYSSTKTVGLSGSSTYVRAEVRNSSGTQTVMSEPILFRDVAGLPAGISFHVDGVTTPSGHDYTRTAVGGITGATWDPTSASLSMTLANPSGSLVELETAMADATPVGVSVAGTAQASSATLADFAGATTSTWFFDAGAHLLHVKAVQAAATTPVVVRLATTSGGGPTPTANASATATATGSTTVTLRPTADAYVRSDQPTVNFGGTSLRVDGSPIIRSYLRFAVSGLSGAVSKATLRVYANSAQSPGYDVFGVSGTTWGETAITYANAPPFAATKTGSSGPASTGAWTSVDVTPLVAGNGTYSFGLSTTGGTALSLASRESTSPPQLVVTTASGTPTPSASPAPTASPTPTATTGATPTPSSAPTGTPAPTASGAAITLRPAADAYVQSDQPTVNFGTGTSLRVDGSPAVRAYLRFGVTGLAAAPSRAILRIYANSVQSTGFDVWGVASTTWGETAITYSNAPPFAAAKSGSSGVATAGTWLTVDVTSLIGGNGTYSLGLSTSNATALSLGSRESANAPQLVLTP